MTRWQIKTEGAIDPILGNTWIPLHAGGASRIMDHRMCHKGDSWIPNEPCHRDNGIAGWQRKLDGERRHRDSYHRQGSNGPIGVEPLKGMGMVEVKGA